MLYQGKNVKKIAFNDLKENGFQTKSQMRYLLRLAREHPEKYEWVYDILREHGAPGRDGPLGTHWYTIDEGGYYNMSPETPSYKYKKRSASLIVKIIKAAESFDETGETKKAEQLDKIASKQIKKLEEN